ncbi:MAG: DUF3471 domain-containing protein [Acidobacteriota bacterium]
MKRNHPFFLLLIGAALAGGCASLPAAEPGIGRQIRARLDAYARGSAEEWARFVADDCLCGLETKADIERAIANRPPGVRNWYGDISDLQVRPLGDAMVARYRVTEYTEVDGRRATAEMWRTETYALRKGTWMLIAGADIVIPAEPVAAQVDPSLFDSYVGRYEYTPGAVDTVTREGDRLFVQPTGEPRVELFPENETTYFAKGEGWRLIFVRDPQGAVTSLIFRQQGQDFTATRIP